MIIRVKHRETEVVIEESGKPGSDMTTMRYDDQKGRVMEVLTHIFEQIQQMYPDENQTDGSTES